MFAETAPDAAVPIDPRDSALPPVDRHVPSVAARDVAILALDAEFLTDVAADRRAGKLVVRHDVRKSPSPELFDRCETHLVEVMRHTAREVVDDAEAAVHHRRTELNDASADRHE